MQHTCSIQDIQTLIAKAVEVLQEELDSEDRYVRVHAAQQILSIPISTSLSLAQELKDTFPKELPES